jgi:urease accessory protein UreF
MQAHPQFTPDEVRELQGGCNQLLAQLGGGAGSVAGKGSVEALQLARIENAPALRQFLGAYVAEILLPVELPAIARAFRLTSCNELRELLELTRELSREPKLRGFATASRQVGRSQLNRLRPLTDQRLVQRFLQAVEQGQAAPWHTVVFGLTLAVYSLPLRQGAVHYAQQMLGGFVEAAAETVPLAAGQAAELLEELTNGLADRIGAVIASEAGTGLRVV